MIPLMHELTRRAYLQELGIDSYSSRNQLLGAAQTRRLVIKRRPPAILTDTEVSTIDLNSGQPVALEEPSSIAEIALGFTSSTKKPSESDKQIESPVAPPTKVKVAPVQAFTVAVIVSGSWLWIEELTHGVLSRDQVHLIQAMAKALGANEPKSHSSQFDWPIHNNAQLDLGTEAARAGLAGFVQRKFEQHDCRGLVVLGRACEQRLAIQQLRIERCVSTVSTAEMLASPLLKKQAWEAISPLSSVS